MASRASIVEYLVEQLGAGISSRAMFGEYAVYRHGVVIGLVCDDRLFLKQTAAGRALLGDEVQEAPAYPGAKLSLVVPEERWDDSEFMAALARVTAEGLPAPKLRAVAKRGAIKPVTKPRATTEPAAPAAKSRATAKRATAKPAAAKPTAKSRATAKPSAKRVAAKPTAKSRATAKPSAKRVASKPTAKSRATAKPSAKSRSTAASAKSRAVKPRSAKRRTG